MKYVVSVIVAVVIGSLIAFQASRSKTERVESGPETVGNSTVNNEKVRRVGNLKGACERRTELLR